MRILVCFKVNRDIEHITPSELCDLRDGKLDLSIFKNRFGVYDEAALENALRLADSVKQMGYPATVDAVTVGECDERFAKDLYSLGFETVYRIHIEECETRPPELIAKSIGELVEKNNDYYAIFTGKQSCPSESGQVPYILAACLRMPCMPDVLEVRLGNNGIIATTKTEVGTSTRVVHGPAVYIVGDAIHPYLRAATLRERLGANSRSVKEYIPKIHNLYMDAGQCLRYMFEPYEKNCELITGETVEEKTKMLWEQCLMGMNNI